MSEWPTTRVKRMDAELVRYVRKGWTVTSQRSDGGESFLSKRGRFSLIRLIVSGVIFYPLIRQKDRSMRIYVSPDGEKVERTEGKA